MHLSRFALTCVVLTAACAGANTDSADTTAARASESTAGSMTAATQGGVTATMHDSAGRDLGTLTLTETAQGIQVSGKLTGLPPGEHAIHLHTVGSCEPPFTSAGGHWNPTNKQHGTQNSQGPHMGDMANFTVGADSSAAIQTSTPGGMLRGANGLLDSDGAAVMVHAGADDYRSDPAGNAGARIACGVVKGA